MIQAVRFPQSEESEENNNSDKNIFTGDDKKKKKNKKSGHLFKRCCFRMKKRQSHIESEPEHSEYFQFMERQVEDPLRNSLTGSLLHGSVNATVPSCSSLPDKKLWWNKEEQAHLANGPYFERCGSKVTTWRPYKPYDFRTITPNIFRGSTCKIHLVQHIPSRMIAIMKVLSGKNTAEAFREQTMANISKESPFLLRILDTMRQEDIFYLLLEYAPFRTLEYLNLIIQGLGCGRTAFYAREIACALDFLHKNKIIHRDVKPENMFILRDGHAVLGDYGSVWDMSKSVYPRTLCGTYVTRPPEVWEGGFYDYSADVYEFGISMWNLITNKWPILRANKVHQKECVQKGMIFFPREEFSILSKELIRMMVEVDPMKRPDMKNILKHKYFSNVSSSCPPFEPAELLDLYPLDCTQRKELENLLFLRRTPKEELEKTACKPSHRDFRKKKLFVHIH